MNEIALAFVPEPRMIPLAQLLPTRALPGNLDQTAKLLQIKASIDEIGLIEPLSVIPLPDSEGRYSLLDGHIRGAALRLLGSTEAPCLEATEDESYTYNNRVNRLSTVQEHFMIRRALDRGVPLDRLSRALNVDVSYLRKKNSLLVGLCNEVISLLANRQFSPDLSRVLRKMKAFRQIECVELMLSADNFTIAYAEAILGATSAEHLIAPKRARPSQGLSVDQLAKMEREMSSLQAHYKEVEHDYGQDVLTFVVVRGYISKLTAKTSIARFLKAKAPDIFEQFMLISDTLCLEDAGGNGEPAPSERGGLAPAANPSPR